RTQIADGDRRAAGRLQAAAAGRVAEDPRAETEVGEPVSAHAAQSIEGSRGLQIPWPRLAARLGPNTIIAPCRSVPLSTRARSRWGRSTTRPGATSMAR